eukprot:12905353-Prorocentrum_lima.AAC.1
MKCIQCPTFKNVWKVVSDHHSEVVGFFMVYVDDVIMFGSTAMVEKIIYVFKQTWKCRVTGITTRDGCTPEEQ